MNAYSEDLRKKIIEAVERRAMKKSEVARLFGVSLSSVKRYVSSFAKEGRFRQAKHQTNARRWTSVPGDCWKPTLRSGPSPSSTRGVSTSKQWLD